VIFFFPHVLLTLSIAQGDRSHIPDSVKGVYQVFLAELENFKKIVVSKNTQFHG
jgi:hypothetical protein